MWKTVKLGEICDFEGGSQPPKKEFVYEPAEGYIRFLQIRDFKSDKNITYIPIAKKNRLCAEDDILIGRYGASVGQILSGLTGAYNVALMKSIPNEEVISKGWLHAYLTSTLFQHPLMKASSRSAQNGFSKDDIYDFAVPLPPLAEQQSIVAKLDAAFAEIDGAIAKIKAKELKIQNLTSKLISHINYSKGSNTVKLGDVCDLIGGGTPSKRNPEYYKGDIQWATVRDMHSDNLIDTELSITNEGLNNSSSKVIKRGNVIIASRVGLGKVCLLSQDTAINQDLKGVVPFDDNILDSNYLFYWFKSLVNTIISAGRGATVQGVSLPFLKALPLNLPSLQEQRYMVTKLDSAFKDIKILKGLLNKSKENYKALKLAILAQELQSEAA
jgi:type I restriction enzyme, S subunit